MVPSVHWNPHDPGTQLRTTCGVHAPHMESKRDKIRNISWNKSHISSHIIVSNESWNSMLYDELMQFVMGLAILSIPHWSSFVLSPLYIIRWLTKRAISNIRNRQHFSGVSNPQQRWDLPMDKNSDKVRHALHTCPCIEAPRNANSKTGFNYLTKRTWVYWCLLYPPLIKRGWLGNPRFNSLMFL